MWDAIYDEETVFHNEVCGVEKVCGKKEKMEEEDRFRDSNNKSICNFQADCTSVVHVKKSDRQSSQKI